MPANKVSLVPAISPIQDTGLSGCGLYMTTYIISASRVTRWDLRCDCIFLQETPLTHKKPLAPCK
jgi:hypothetical protein